MLARREALAEISGAGAYQYLYSTYYTTNWSSYYGKDVQFSFCGGQREKWTRNRVQYETSYWNYYF